MPYIIVQPLSFGPFVWQPFGLLAMAGIVIRWRLVKRRGQSLGMPENDLESLLWWAVISGFIGAHIVENVFYHPQELVKEPMRIFMLWRGLSTFAKFEFP